MKMSKKKYSMLILVGSLILIPGVILIMSKFPNLMNIVIGSIITICGFAIMSMTSYVYNRPKVRGQD